MAEKFPKQSVRDAVDRSVQNSKHLRAVHSAPVAALRILADRIDMPTDAEPEESAPLPQFDNVSIPTFLKYCQALGLTPDLKAAPAPVVKRAPKPQPVKPAPVRGLEAFKQEHKLSG